MVSLGNIDQIPRKIFTGGMAAYLKLRVREVERRHPEIVTHEVNTDQDHMHILLSVAPKLSLSQSVSLIKANTARDMRDKFPFLDKVHWAVKIPKFATPCLKLSNPLVAPKAP